MAMGSENLFSLSGKVALVTGGSRGIGEMIAQGFLSAGACKVYISSRSHEACSETAKRLNALGYQGECLPLPANISTVEGCCKLAAELSNLEPRLDILVNNAGLARAQNFDMFSEKSWDSVMNLNLKSVFFLTQQMAPLLRNSSGSARVINIGSVDGFHITPNEAYSYVSSKAALMQLTALLARRLVGEGILVNCIAPGAFPTKMNGGANNNSNALSKFIPAGRVGTAEDIAGPCIMLASRAGEYCVGVTITVDGGVSRCGGKASDIQLDPSIKSEQDVAISEKSESWRDASMVRQRRSNL